MKKMFFIFMVLGTVICAKAQNSNNYYNTGDVINLHRHTVGNGIIVVFIGDGFDREDCRKGGVYEYNCRKMTELFLSMPVVRDFKNYFDVCARVDVSKDRGARNCVTDPGNCPDNAYGSGHPDLSWHKIHRNATSAAGRDDRLIIFMANGMIGGHIIDNIAIYSANEPNKAYWMMHEFAGHVLGSFPDLYYVTGDKPMNEGAKKAFDHGHSIGEFSMFDWRNDPKEVYWKDFIGRKGYEMVGIYPAGFWDLKFGEFFTCEDVTASVMYSEKSPRYTVMERFQLWQKIQLRAGFKTTSVNEFIKYDAVNLKEKDWSWTRYKEWTDDRIWSAANSAADTLRVMSFNIRVGGGKSIERTIAAVRESGAGIVGIQEETKNAAATIAKSLEWNYVHTYKSLLGKGCAIISKYPIVDSTPAKTGVKLRIGENKYAWMFNQHLNHCPYEPYRLSGREYCGGLLRTEEEAIASAWNARKDDVELTIAEITKVQADKIPVFLTGDFNEPSYLDWTERAAKSGLCKIPVAWPATKNLHEKAGMKDSYRTFHPDEISCPGHTWTSQPADENEIMDRIDFVLFCGNATVIKSEIVGEKAPESDIVVRDYPSDHRAVLSTFLY